MRPLALHLEGFGVFREPVDIDFDGVDYFALVGATGAGKSTVIDAVCFALYGSIPRYGDERMTARVVSVGKQEAKVSLTFTVGDAQYRATRVVRIRNGKASTPEALLERLPTRAGRESEMLAGSAREMRPAVERLLGLPFAHFTKCVVLPQGEFARFLHDDPSKRRDLLTRLLDFEIYDRIGQLARQRAAAAKQAVEIHERQLATYADASEEARTRAEQRRAQLLDLHHVLNDARPEDQRLMAAIAEAEQRARAASEVAAELQSVAVPRAIGKQTEKFERLRSAAQAATEVVERAQHDLTALDEEVAGLPDRSELLATRDAHRVLADLATELEAAAAAEAVAADTATHTADLAAQADANVVEAQQRLDEIRDAHAAHALAARLTKGELCPVCRQVVEQVPKRSRLKAMATVEHDLDDARATAVTARDAVEQTARAHADATATRRQLEARAATARERTAQFPGAAGVAAELARIDGVLAAHNEARTRERQARAALADATEQLTAADTALESHRTELREQRDRFVRAGLEPPAAGGDDLAAGWTALHAWAKAAATEQAAAAATAQHDATAARDERAKHFGDLFARAQKLRVDSRASDLDGLRDDVLEQGRDARNELQRIDDALEQSRKVAEELTAAREEHDVADLLGSRLRSDRFEKWVLVEALEILVGAASQILFSLSNGQYSLRSSTEDEFVVVDHRNADETRSVRTLSGGETFQASLALALALSDQLVELSASGGVKLDAIFLDEGFGTLDADALETVAGTIETLGTGGRMVGIVTHVPALAERVPVRYRVARTDRGARVEREEG